MKQTANSYVKEAIKQQPLGILTTNLSDVIAEELSDIVDSWDLGETLPDVDSNTTPKGSVEVKKASDFEVKEGIVLPGRTNDTKGAAGPKRKTQTEKGEELFKYFAPLCDRLGISTPKERLRDSIESTIAGQDVDRNFRRCIKAVLNANYSHGDELGELLYNIEDQIHRWSRRFYFRDEAKLFAEYKDQAIVFLGDSVLAAAYDENDALSKSEKTYGLLPVAVAIMTEDGATEEVPSMF